MCNYVEDTHTFTKETTPEEFIDLMYDNLNEDGVTFIPGPYDDSKYGEELSATVAVSLGAITEERRQRKNLLRSLMR